MEKGEAKGALSLAPWWGILHGVYKGGEGRLALSLQPNMSSPTPTYARIRSLSHWTTFFNQPDGLFRLPSTQGAAIQHLDIDLRFVADHQVETVDPHLETDTPIHLPNVCVLTFRGGEYVQDDDLRMDALAEVLLAVNPVEVRW